MQTTSSVDTKKTLSSLRKLYLNLQKTEREQCIEQHDLIFAELLFAESMRRRIQSGHSEESTRKHLIQIASYLDQQFKLKYGSILLERNEAISILSSQLQRSEQLLNQYDENFAGYFYQFSSETARRTALDRIQSADKKCEKEDLIHFTQLYTPRWVAEYLAANTILPQWKNTSKTETSFHKVFKPRSAKRTISAVNFKALDPAAGCGHLLLPTFDLLFEMHMHEGHEPDFSVENILTKCLHGADLDSHALWVCGFALILKAINRLDEKQIDRLLQKLNLKLTDVSNTENASSVETGSLNKNWQPDHILAHQYDAIVSNPPYIGRRLLDRRLKQFLKLEYPKAHNDISAAFLVRALELCKPAGFVAFITQASLLYLPSYGELRKDLLESNQLCSVTELGTGVFPLVAGEKINSMLILLEGSASAESHAKEQSTQGSAEFLDLSKYTEKQALLESACRFPNDSPAHFIERTYADLKKNREAAYNYKCPPFLQRIMLASKKLSELAEVKQGLATSDNERFVKYWWDVLPSEIGSRWHPYIKGAGSERWHASCQTVVDWGKDGSEIKTAVETNYPYLKGKTSWVVKNESYYFKEGLTFSFVSTGLFAARQMPEGSIFDVGGSALFFQNHDDLQLILAYLNSSFAALCVNLLNPTFNCQVGDIKQVPLLKMSAESRRKLQDIASKCLEAKCFIHSFDETRIKFTVDKRVAQLCDGADPESAWRAISSDLNNARSLLETAENELDSLILHSLHSEFSCSDIELSDLNKQIAEKQSVKQKPKLFIASKKELAEFALRNILSNQTKAIQEFSAESLPIPASLRAWMESQLEQSIDDYLSSSFNKTQLKIYNSSPRILFRQKSPNKNVIVSNEALRALIYNRNGADSLTEIESSTLQELKAKLVNHGWTGKNLQQALFE